MPKILICDDDKNTRKALRALFTMLNYSIDEADNGLVAIEKIDREDYQMVLMDIDMPEINGIETIKRIRNSKKNQNVIIITGHKLSDLMEEAFKNLDVYDIVEKPFDMEYLKNIVAECISLNA